MDIQKILNYEILFNPLSNYLFILIIIFSSYLLYYVLKLLIKKELNPYFEGKDFLFKNSIIKNLNSFIKITIVTIVIYLCINILYLSSFENFKFSLKIFLIVYFVYYLVKISQIFLNEFLSNSQFKQSINQTAIELLIKISKISILVVAFLLIISNLGYDVTALLTGLGIGGLALALAAQDILKNFFSGIFLIFDKNFNKGDKVSFGNTIGLIDEVSLRTTKIKTFDGSVLTVPNSELSNSVLENRTKMPKDKNTMTIGLVYDTSSKKIKKAKEIIKKCILEEEKSDENEIYIWFENFSAYSLDIKVIYYTKYKQSDWPDRIYLKDRVNLRIKEKFEKEKIEFAFPTQTIELKK